MGRAGAHAAGVSAGASAPSSTTGGRGGRAATVSMTSRAEAGTQPARRPDERDLPHAHRRGRRGAHRRRGRGDLRGARRPGRRVRVRAGPVADPAPGRSTASSSGASTPSAPRRAPARGSASGRSPTGCSRAGWSTTYAPATRSTCRPRAAGSAPTRRCSRAGGTCASPPGPASRRCCRSPQACWRTDGDVTLLYGNRTTGSVMFAEELADLKNRYGPQLQLVHVLSREPRDVELFSGRLDADRLRRLLTTLVPAARFDHVWLCGPHAMLLDAQEVLAELGVPRGARPLRALLRRRAAPRAAPRRGRGHRRDHRGDGRARRAVHDGGAAARADRPRRRPGDARPTSRSRARAASAAPAAPRSRQARSTCAATTRSSPPRSRQVSCSPARAARWATPSRWTTTHDRPVTRWRRLARCGPTTRPAARSAWSCATSAPAGQWSR